MEQHPKIFGIGFNKTGTTTLKRCYTILDLGPIAPAKGRMVGRVNRRLLYHKDYRPALKMAEKFSCFEDRPWNVWQMYCHLDRRFPGSCFILTVREPEKWWRSVDRWLSHTKPWMASDYRRHLQDDNLLKESMIRQYCRYNQEVRDYFADRNDFLEIDFEKGDGWEPICDFLGCSVPAQPFPHANRQHYDLRDLNRKRPKVGLLKRLFSVVRSSLKQL